jgi:hypothetical protein
MVGVSSSKSERRFMVSIEGFQNSMMMVARWLVHAPPNPLATPRSLHRRADGGFLIARCGARFSERHARARAALPGCTAPAGAGVPAKPAAPAPCLCRTRRPAARPGHSTPWCCLSSARRAWRLLVGLASPRTSGLRSATSAMRIGLFLLTAYAVGAAERMPASDVATVWGVRSGAKLHFTHVNGESLPSRGGGGYPVSLSLAPGQHILKVYFTTPDHRSTEPTLTAKVEAGHTYVVEFLLVPNTDAVALKLADLGQNQRCVYERTDSLRSTNALRCSRAGT